MVQNPELCITQIKKLAHNLIHAKLITGGLISGEVVCQEMQQFVEVVMKEEAFREFNPSSTRLDVFLVQHMAKYENLLGVVKNLLILSHGQAAVERGFSINKETIQDNQHADTLIAQRIN